MLDLKGFLRSYFANLFQRKPEMVGYLVVYPMWIPSVQDQLLDDLVLDVGCIRAHYVRVRTKIQAFVMI